MDRSCVRRGQTSVGDFPWDFPSTNEENGQPSRFVGREKRIDEGMKGTGGRKYRREERERRAWRASLFLWPFGHIYIYIYIYIDITFAAVEYPQRITNGAARRLSLLLFFLSSLVTAIVAAAAAALLLYWLYCF